MWIRRYLALRRMQLIQLKVDVFMMMRYEMQCAIAIAMQDNKNAFSKYTWIEHVWLPDLHQHQSRGEKSLKCLHCNYVKSIVSIPLPVQAQAEDQPNIHQLDAAWYEWRRDGRYQR